MNDPRHLPSTATQSRGASFPGFSLPAPRSSLLHARAFTLIEMIAVIAIISIFLGVVGVALRNRGSESVGLETAQSVVASAFTLVRSQAALSGQTGALMVFADTNDPERYLRYIVPAVDEGGNWRAISDGYFLPVGCYIVPNGGPPAGAVEPGADWASAPSVRSSALQNSGSITLGGVSTSAESWTWMEVGPRGSTSNSGDIVLATGRVNQPGAASPITFTNPENVRGIGISTYGQFTLLNNRNDL